MGPEAKYIWEVLCGTAKLGEAHEYIKDCENQDRQDTCLCWFNPEFSKLEAERMSNAHILDQ